MASGEALRGQTPCGCLQKVSHAGAFPGAAQPVGVRELDFVPAVGPQASVPPLGSQSPQPPSGVSSSCCRPPLRITQGEGQPAPGREQRAASGVC